MIMWRGWCFKKTKGYKRRLLIIDMLQKVREVGGDRYGYSSDYEIVIKLKSFNDKYGVYLLVVHYTRRLESENSFDMISGTNGLLSVAGGRLSCTRKSAWTTQRLWILCGVTSPIRFNN